jgi:hypothetical protein
MYVLITSGLHHMLEGCLVSSGMLVKRNEDEGSNNLLSTLCSSSSAHRLSEA